MARDDPEFYEDDEDDLNEESDDSDSEGPEVGVTIEIVGLSLFTHHGVTAAEREIGAQARSYKTLERLCAVIADRLAAQFGADSVTVKASKPEPPIPLPVEEVSVEVWREEH